MIRFSRVAKVSCGVGVALGALLFVLSQTSSAQQLFRLRPQMPGRPTVLPLDNGAIYTGIMGGNQGGGGFGGGQQFGGGGFGGGQQFGGGGFGGGQQFG